MYRYDETVETTVLIAGTLKRVNKDKNLEDEYEKELEEDSIVIHKGLHAIHSVIAH